MPWRLQGEPSASHGWGRACSTVNRLFPGVDAEGLDQAALGVKVGGLGLRRARDTALPAALASKIAAEPKVRHMGQCMARAGLLRDGQLESQF
eukprot:3550874-Karenia_brevis.AAC.1